MKQLPLAALLAAAALTLAGCAATPAAAPAPSAAAASDAAALLARHDLQGLSAEQLVERLDAATDDRIDGPAGSVRPNEVILSDAEGQATLPLPSDRFYLAFAPYVTRTHECFHHNLATCQGELVSTALDVTITTDAGETLVDEQLTTHANGFAGVWLPAGIAGTITVEVDGRTVTAPITTGPDDPTCLTTLQLA